VSAAPRTRYVRNGDVNIAYQVVGEGPIDLLFVPGWFSHLDFFWEMPAPRAFFEALARFSRLITYDKRGTGLSDPVERAGSYADRIDDLRAVMDAAGARQPVICALSEGGIVAAIFAAAEPERTRSLILLNTPMSPGKVPEFERWREEVADAWGEGALFERLLPEVADVPRARDLWARTQRMSASRGVALQYLEQIAQLDAAPTLPAISVPTLVLRGTLDEVVTAQAAREMADAIPGARFREVACGHIPWLTGGQDAAAAIEEFATGAVPVTSVQRRLATVLFTDIVESTAKAATLGDRQWRGLLDRHDDVVRVALHRCGGREVKATGDGFLAAFDGPAEAIECAVAARAGTAELGIETRAGIHMGQCEVRGDDLGGIAVHIGARVAALAGPGEILVSRTVRDLIAGSDVTLEDRGEHALKGVPDEWRLYAVT